MEELEKLRCEIRPQYAASEAALEMRVKSVLNRIQLNFNREVHQESSSANDSWKDENTDALNRNEKFLKDLEIQKAKLRSLYCYQPATSHFSYLVKEFKTKKDKSATSMKDSPGSSGPIEKVYEHESGIKQITSFNSDRFHVKSSLDEWINTHYDSLETIVVDETDLPRFEFNVKIHQQPQQKKRDVYIPCCAVAHLKQLHEHQRAQKIIYSAPNLIKFAVNYSESEHVLKAHEIPKQRRKRLPYREPNDEHVARLVAQSYHRSADTLAELSDQDVVYYFLSVLRNANCAPLNRALAEARRRSPDLYQSAVLPGRVASSSGSIPYYTQYAEIIHFLGLMSPPRRMGDNGADIVEKVRQRNVEQTRQLCESVGISTFAATDRGREWLKIVRFFDANADWCAVMGAAVVEADEATLTVIEKQTLQQVRQLWRWRKMQDFYNCYTFATRCATAVHQLEVVAQQCQQVEQQYRRLVNHAKGNEQQAPYMSFYVADKQLQGLTNVEVYPELLYAAVSTSFKTKRGNSVWEQFVATRPARIARDEIERLLAIDTSSQAEDEFEEPKSSGCCSNAESWHPDQELLGDASYFNGDFSHFETDNMEPVRTESAGPPDCAPSGLGDILPSNPGLADVLVDWDSVVASGQCAKDEQNPELEFGLCDPLAENIFPRGSGTFNLESHLNDGAEKSCEKTEKSTEPGTD